MQNFSDKIAIDLASKRNSKGFLEFDAKIARVGIQHYMIDGELKPVMRDASEVFATDSINSFENTPVTLDHPTEPVTPSNFNTHAVGFARDMKQEGDYLVGKVIVTTDAGIKAVESGKSELSGGYTAETVLKDGLLHQTNIRANHIAIVDKGRCSDNGTHKCALKLDKGVKKVADNELHKDTIELATTKLQLDTVTAEKVALIADNTALKSELDKLSGAVKVLTDTNETLKLQVDGFAVTAIKSEVSQLNKELKLDSLTTVNDVKVAFIKSKMPTFDSKDLSNGYIDGMFDTLKIQNPLKSFGDCGTKTKDVTEEEARANMIKNKGAKNGC